MTIWIPIDITNAHVIPTPFILFLRPERALGPSLFISCDIILCVMISLCLKTLQLFVHLTSFEVLSMLTNVVGIWSDLMMNYLYCFLEILGVDFSSVLLCLMALVSLLAL